MYVTECYQSAGNQKHIYTPQKINKYLISFHSILLELIRKAIVNNKLFNPFVNEPDENPIDQKTNGNFHKDE